jgi:hypothetical protein
MNGGRIEQIGRPRAKRARGPNQSVVLLVPRGGLPRSCEINEVGFGGTLKTPTRSLGFLPRVSHLGRDVEPAKLAVIGGGPVSLHVRRSKGCIGTRQPLAARELRALRRLQREASGVHIFVSERDAPLSVAGYQRMVARASDAGSRADEVIE